MGGQERSRNGGQKEREGLSQKATTVVVKPWCVDRV